MASRSKLKPFLFATLLTVVLFVFVEIGLRATTFGCGLPEPNLCGFGNVSYRFNDKPGGAISFRTRTAYGPYGLTGHITFKRTPTVYATRGRSTGVPI